MSINGVVIEPHDHVVNIYGEDRHLVDDVSHFVAAGLAGDGAVVVVATKNHTDSLARELASRIDLQAAIDAGRYRCMDAAEMLSKFMG